MQVQGTRLLQLFFALFTGFRTPRLLETLANHTSLQTVAGTRRLSPVFLVCRKHNMPPDTWAYNREGRAAEGGISI